MPLGRQILKNISTGCVGTSFTFLAALNSHLIKQNFTKLLRGSDVKLATSQSVNFVLKPCHFLCEVVGHAGQVITINLDSCHFHFRQNRNQRALHRLVNSGQPVHRQPRFQQFPQPQRHVRIFGGIWCRVVDWHFIKRNRGFPCAKQRLDRNRSMVQIAFR